MTTKVRYTVLDVLRGGAVIAMIIYHALWDLVNIFGVYMPWFSSTTASVIQLSIRWAFILISGFSIHLSKRKLRHALTVLGASLIITLVTFIFTPEARILFGVLSLLGSAVLLTIPLNKPMKKINPTVGIVICALLFVLTYNLPRGFVGVGDFALFELPDFLYCHTLTAFFGFKPAGFFSTDYVPLLPWLFMFWIGYYVYLFFEKYNLLRFMSAFSLKPLEFVGRHSLIIYMLHQPVVYGLLYIIFNVIM